MRDHAADDDAGGQTHIAGSPHGAAEQIQHADGYGAAERHVRVGKRGRQYLAMSAHPSKDEWRAKEQHDRERRGEAKRQNKRVQRERVGDDRAAGAERACNRGRDAAAHAARRRVLDQHHEREGERHAGERVRAKTTEKQPVERDHAGNREEVKDIRRREPQQRGQDRPFEQQLGARRDRAGSGRTGRGGRRE